MSQTRLERMMAMVASFPQDPRARYFLAHELFRAEDWAGAAEHYAAYVRLEPGDNGAAYKNLGLCLERTGRSDEAASAYRKGVESALAHGHDGLASEMHLLLDDLEA